jgi:pimeloyl-ACP methyl ester carboxylesterase
MLALYVIAALLAALVLANLLLGRLPKKPPAGGGVIETAQGPIHYLENIGEGTPIVFIHGMPGSCRDFDLVRERMRDRHTIAFDRPGYAWSTGPPRDFGEQLDAIIEAAGALGVERAVVVGHSFGGMSALGLAIRHATFVDRLLLLSPAAGGTRVGEDRERQARWIERIETPGVCQVLDLFFLRILRKHASRVGATTAYGSGPELAVQRLTAESALATHTSVRALANDRQLFNDTERMLTRNLKRVGVPSLILHGEQDETVTLRNARRLAEALPNTRLVDIPGDHQLPTKNPAQVVEALEQLLADQLASSAQ